MLFLVFFAIIASVISFIIINFMPGFTGQIVGFLFAVLVGLFCLRSLCSLVGREHALVKLIGRVPVLCRIVSYE